MRHLYQLLGYSFVGAINTMITFIAFSILLYYGTNIYAANGIGYLAGLTNSYYMNRTFTFASRGSVTKFLAAFIVSYSMNIVAIMVATNQLTDSQIMAQGLGMITYNIVFFVLMKNWVYS